MRPVALAASVAMLTLLVLDGCAGQTGSPTRSGAPPPRSDSPLAASVAPPTIGASNPAPAISATPAASSAATPWPSVAGPVASSAPHDTNGKIAFVRYDLSADEGRSFLIDPSGSQEVQVGTGDVVCSTLSVDKERLLCAVFIADEGARPAIADADGSGFKVLDAYPGQHRSLWCRDWLAQDTRLLCTSDQGGDPADNGLYTLRSSDGGDLKRVTVAPAGCTDTDQVRSPNAMAVLFDRICGSDEHGTLFNVNLNGSDPVQLSPTDLSIASVFTGLGADWSPDGSKVTFGALVPSADSTALYVVNADGSRLDQIVSTDVGAVTAQWSPDGQWIAFTSRYRSNPQVWRVRPDGTGLEKLTDGTDGSDSVAAEWSPDSTKLVYANVNGDQSNILIMHADGTKQTRLTDGSGDWHWWLPAP
jgi:hypothetical protein